MKKMLLFKLVLCVLFFNSRNSLFAQVNDVQLYGFIHSLVVHQPPLIPTPNDETTTPYWLNEIANSTTNTFGFTGRFGQLTDHVDQLPAQPLLGLDGVSSPWDADDGNTFANSGINTVLLTAANFIQWVPPTDSDPADPQGRTIVAKTETLFDWTNNQNPNIRYFIYGNWPEMDTAQPFPSTVPTETEIDEFHDITLGNTGTFNSWWLNYHDEIVESRPGLNIKLIPVGRIISQILTQIIPDEIPFDELYEDSAPHGRANTYFLAGLVTYMALYEQQVPASYMPGTIIHSSIRDNLATINSFIWQELNNFNFSNGSSRVFHSNTLSNNEFESLNKTIISPNPVTDTISILNESNLDIYSIEIYDTNGRLLMTKNGLENLSFNVSNLPKGLYILKGKDISQKISFTNKFIKY